MMLTFIAIGAFVATSLGGLLALKFRDKLHLILGFSAGALIGVAFFDLLPEAIELTSSAFQTSTVTAFVALGFIIFMIVDRFIAPPLHFLHQPSELFSLFSAVFSFILVQVTFFQKAIISIRQCGQPS